MTLNNHIIFNPEAVEPLHASLHVEVPRPNEDPIVPAHQKRSLIGPKETNLDVTPQADPDTDDNMETTSLTDDDPVDAAFNTVLDRPEDLMDNEADEEDDEIVWDPRSVPFYLSFQLFFKTLISLEQALLHPSYRQKSTLSPSRRLNLCSARKLVPRCRCLNIKPANPYILIFLRPRLRRPQPLQRTCSMAWAWVHPPIDRYQQKHWQHLSHFYSLAPKAKTFGRLPVTRSR